MKNLIYLFKPKISMSILDRIVLIVGRVGQIFKHIATAGRGLILIGVFSVFERLKTGLRPAALGLLRSER